MEVTDDVAYEDDLLGKSDDDEEIPPYQVPKKRKQQHQSRERHRQRSTSEPRRENNPRKRRHSPSTNRSHSLSAEDRISWAEGAIKSLKRHTDKGTCPEFLQYRARAKIRADDDFKIEIKQIWKQAEKETLKAIIRFHQREIEHFKVEIKRGKKALNFKNCRSTEPAHIAQAVNNDLTIETGKQIAVNLQAQIAQFGTMMETLGAIESKEVKKYTCVFSDSQHKHGAIKQISKTKRLPTNKRKERRKIRHQKRSDITIEANKKHIKNLSNKEHTNDHINLLAKGLNFIPIPVTKQRKSDNNFCVTLISSQEECVLCT